MGLTGINYLRRSPPPKKGQAARITAGSLPSQMRRGLSFPKEQSGSLFLKIDLFS